MSYFVDNLTLNGNITIPTENDTIGIYFLKSKYKTIGYYNKSDIENTFCLLIPYLNFHLSSTETNPRDKVLIYLEETKQQLGEYEIITRETVRNMKSFYEGKIDFNWNKDNEKTETIDCSLHYTVSEMNWIKVGISPQGMEDRVIMYVDDDENTINFYGSWQGYGLYKAFFRKVTTNNKIKIDDVISKGSSFEVYRLIAIKRPYRDSERLLSDFVSQLKYHFNDLEFAERQQESIKLKLQEKE